MVQNNFKNIYHLLVTYSTPKGFLNWVIVKIMKAYKNIKLY